MYGIALGVHLDLKLLDITHNIEAFNTWNASYSLFQTCPAFPPGCVFVSVIDPGVGTNRKSVVALTGANHYIVTPDNGTLTHIAKHIKISALREIDESTNRVKGSENSHVFHGRDVYAYTGARLAGGIIDFEGVGPELNPDDIVRHPTPDAMVNSGRIEGMIDIIDPLFGMVWTNIPIHFIEETEIDFGSMVSITIWYKDEIKYQKKVLYGKSFGSVKEGEDILYNNEIGFFAVGTNMKKFVEKYNIHSGIDWTIRLEKI